MLAQQRDRVPVRGAARGRSTRPQPVPARRPRAARAASTSAASTPTRTSAGRAVDGDQRRRRRRPSTPGAARPRRGGRASGPGSRCGWSARRRSVTSASTSAGSRRGGVGGREVAGDQHERVAGLRDAGHRQPEARRRRARSRDVVQVGDPLGEVAAGRLERRPVHGERGVDRVRRVRAVAGSASAARVGQRPGPRPSSTWASRISAAGRLRGARSARRARSAATGAHAPRPPACLGLRVDDRRLRRRQRRRRRHPVDRPGREPGADPDPLAASQSPSRTSSASRSRASRSARSSRAASAPSPSASRVTSVPLLGAERQHREHAAAPARLLLAGADRHRHRLLRGGGDEQRGGPGVQAAGGADGDGSGRASAPPSSGLDGDLDACAAGHDVEGVEHVRRAAGGG